MKRFLALAALCFLATPALAQDAPKIDGADTAFMIVATALERRAVRADRLVGPSQIAAEQDFFFFHPGDGVALGVTRARMPNLHHHATEVEGIEMPWLQLGDLDVAIQCLCQQALLMLSHGLLK